MAGQDERRTQVAWLVLTVLFTSVALALFFLHIGGFIWTLALAAAFFPANKVLHPLIDQVQTRLVRQRWSWPRMARRLSRGVYLVDRRRWGIVGAHETRAQISPDEWARLLGTDGARRLQAMGQSLAPLLQSVQQREIILRQLSEGCEVRVLLIHPNRRESLSGQLSELEMRLDTDLSEKIERSVDGARDLWRQLGAADAKRLRLRVSTETMYSSFLSVDDEMIVSFYTSDPHGDSAPTLHLVGESRPLYKRLHREFDELYARAKPPLRLHHAERIRIASHHAHARKIVDTVQKGGGDLPVPNTVIVFPTHRCSAGCGYCMYRDEHATPGDGLSMTWSDMSRLLDDLASTGVRSVEFSGGGEPTEYPHFEQLVDKCLAMVESGSKIKFGLLSNGLQMPVGDVLDKLCTSFTYCRLSYAEPTMKSSDHRRKFDAALDAIVDAKKRTGSDMVLGVKFLLSDNDVDSFCELVAGFSTDMRLGHVKVKSVRDDELVSQSTVELATDRLAAMILANGRGAERRVQLDLARTPYSSVSEFGCWANALNAVVDPALNVYMCCNYVGDAESKLVGNLRAGRRLKNVWGTEKHLKKVKALTRANCDRPEYCNCRFFDYQMVVENLRLLEEAHQYEDSGAQSALNAFL